MREHYEAPLTSSRSLREERARVVKARAPNILAADTGDGRVITLGREPAHELPTTGA